jgi:hypothetical protein
VEVADHGGEPDDVLAVQVDDEPQHAVRGGMVRPEVDRQHVFEVRIGREHGRNRLRNSGAVVDRRRAGRDGHYSSSEKRTGSPPIG